MWKCSRESRGVRGSKPRGEVQKIEERMGGDRRGVTMDVVET